MIPNEARPWPTSPPIANAPKHQRAEEEGEGSASTSGSCRCGSAVLARGCVVVDMEDLLYLGPKYRASAIASGSEGV